MWSYPDQLGTVPQ